MVSPPASVFAPAREYTVFFRLSIDAPLPLIMLSRAVLPLTRPTVLTSTVRASTVSVPHARWYAKNNKPKTPYKLPHQSNKAAKSEQPAKPSSQKDYSAEQAEFDTKAESAAEAVS